MRHRLGKEERIAVIRQAAVVVGEEAGVLSISHHVVASACSHDTTVGTVRLYFSRVRDLQLLAANNSDKVRTEMDRLGIL